MEIAKVKVMIKSWLANKECCLDRLAQIYGEELTVLERAGAAGKDKEASELFERFDVALQKSYEE